MNKIMRLYLLVLSAIMLTLASCTGRSAQTNSSDGEKNAPLALLIGVMPSIDHLPIAMAKHLGIYDSLDIDISWERFYSPMERDLALQTGQIHATVTDYTTAMTQQAAGIGIHMPLALDGVFYLVTRPDLKAVSASDLSGKRFALSTNTIIEYATDYVMQGIPFEKIEVQKLPIRLEMLAKGEIDAAVLPQPFAQIAMNKGLNVVPDVLGLAAPIRLTGLVLSDALVADNPTVVERLYEGYNLAVDYLNSRDVTEWLPAVAKELGVDVESIRGIKLGTFSYAQAPNSEDLERTAVWLKAKGLIPRAYSAAKLTETKR